MILSNSKNLTGKNEQVKRVFWTLFVAMAGLVLARVMDPVTATKEEFRQIPREPGLYRIKPVGKDFLMYIGETRRTVHERIKELRHTLRRSDLMPWNDPHTGLPPLYEPGRMQKDSHTNVLLHHSMLPKAGDGDGEFPSLPVPKKTSFREK